MSLFNLNVLLSPQTELYKNGCVILIDGHVKGQQNDC